MERIVSSIVGAAVQGNFLADSERVVLFVEVLVPLLALGLAKGFKLDDDAGRAAVLIAALPISLASFSLADRYEIGEAVLSENIALGTVLILPTILLWSLVLDALDLFPIS